MLQNLVKQYEGNDDIAFVAVQTVFEGFQVNSFKKLAPTARKYELDIPFGHDPGSDGKRSNILKRYGTRGTPWVVMVDGDGRVRFSDFHVEEGDAIRRINGLLGELHSVPRLVGEDFPSLEGVQWLRRRSRGNGFGDHDVTLVKLWQSDDDNSCDDLSSLANLYREYRFKGLNMIAVHVGAGTLENEALVQRARELRHLGPLALDAERSILDTLSDEGLPVDVEFPTLLVSRGGRILWASRHPRVHPAPEPTADKPEPTADKPEPEVDPRAVGAFDDLRAVIRRELIETR